MSLYIFTFIVGSLIGSFLNVCIYRIPRDESVIFPSSRCPSCGKGILPWDNIPILSFLMLFGKCRYCGKKISFRYPFVEALNAVLYVSLLHKFGPGVVFAIYAAVVSSMIVITFIDLDFQIIPDRITLTGIPLGLLAGTFILPDPFMRAEALGFTSSLIGFLSGGGLFYLVAVVSRGGMGGGDIKMMAMVGALLGWKAVLLVTFLGSLTGSLAGVSMMVFKGAGRKAKVPFGPFLALGTVITIFFGQEILIWYLFR